MPLSTPVWICLLVTCIMVWGQPIQIYNSSPLKKISKKNRWKVSFQIQGTTGFSKTDYPQPPEDELIQITVYRQVGTKMREFSTVDPVGDRFQATFLPPFTGESPETTPRKVCEINNFMQYAWDHHWLIQVLYGSKRGHYLESVDPKPHAAGKPKYVEMRREKEAGGLTDISKYMTHFTKEKAARKKEMMEKLAKLAPEASLSAMSAELCTKDDEKKAKQEYQSVYDDQVDEYGYYDGGYEEELENMMEWMYLKGYKNGIKRLLNKYNRY